MCSTTRLYTIIVLYIRFIDIMKYELMVNAYAVDIPSYYVYVYVYIYICFHYTILIYGYVMCVIIHGYTLVITISIVIYYYNQLYILTIMLY